MWSYHETIRKIIPTVDFHQNHFARALESTVRQGAWLDVGAGTALHHGFGVMPQQQLASRVSTLVGIDPHAPHLNENQFLTAAVCGHGDQLPFADSTFDILTANMVLEHLERPVAVFNEVRRVLRPGGAFCFVTPNLEHPIVATAHFFLSQRVRSALAVLPDGREEEHGFPTFYRANRVSTLRRLMSTVGMCEESLVVHRNIPFFHRPSLATMAECLFIRACEWSVLRRFGADLVGVYRKPLSIRATGD